MMPGIKVEGVSRLPAGLFEALCIIPGHRHTPQMGDIGWVHGHEFEPAVLLQGGAVLFADDMPHPLARLIVDPSRVIVRVGHVELIIVLDPTGDEGIDL